MNYEFKFATDAVVRGKAYPALAEWQATPYTPEWRQFYYHWPYTVPCELHEHCMNHNFPHQLRSINHCDHSTWVYTIGLGFFDFSIDYFSLIPQSVFDKKMILLFYYHEGDNPRRIKTRLDQLCVSHGLDVNCYRFVSGNTAANAVENFVWFPDHELLYWHRNRDVPASPIHCNTRSWKFTVLNRTHKWWRATVMADLQRCGILDVSQWSYNTDITVGDDPADNPIEIDVLGLRDSVEDFIKSGPYTCDDLTANQHNDHHLHVPAHYTDSYCHIVIETHFDADQSNGSFLTEKTFKPIKHGQPFVIVGGPGSLAALKKLGYRTFDHAIDNSYDSEPDNTRRWQMILKAIEEISCQNLDKWFEKCSDDIYHNQRLFLDSKHNRLNMLFNKLQNND
jgi:hypothetical protein